MKILVTGGAGFIGSHLVDSLVDHGWDVVVLDSLSSGKIDNLHKSIGRIRFIEGDILHLPDLATEIGPVQLIVHLAALISGHDSLNDPDAYVASNIIGTQRVIDFAAMVGARRILFASSSTIYGERGGVALSEDASARPLSVYALSKLAGEELLRLYAPLKGFTHCSLRLFNVYGPRQATDHPYANVTCKFSHAAANGLGVKRFGDGEQSRDFVYIDDVVRAFLTVSDRSRETLYNVGTGEDTSINRLIGTLGEITGTPIAVEEFSPWPNDIRSIRADPGRFEREFGFRPSVTLGEGLRRTVGFFRKTA